MTIFIFYSAFACCLVPYFIPFLYFLIILFLLNIIKENWWWKGEKTWLHRMMGGQQKHQILNKVTWQTKYHKISVTFKGYDRWIMSKKWLGDIWTSPHKKRDDTCLVNNDGIEDGFHCSCHNVQRAWKTTGLSVNITWKCIDDAFKWQSLDNDDMYIQFWVRQRKKYITSKGL